MNNKILFVKPADRFLDNEFVYQQLGPHYLQSYLEEHQIESDIIVLFERSEIRDIKKSSSKHIDSLSDLNMLLIKSNGISIEASLEIELFSEYDIIAMSVMSPQAPDAYRLNKAIKELYPHIITVIGGSHPRYYLDSVKNLPAQLAFNFIVPNDGWQPILDIASNHITPINQSIILSHEFTKINEIPPPTRPVNLLKKYKFEIAGIKSFHTITALGCPFSCNFCESGREKLRKFTTDMIDNDLGMIASAFGDQKKKGLMIFDDVGLMNPKQTRILAQLIHGHGFDTWRAFSHAFLVDRYGDELLAPFYETGGRRIGLGLETGSQRSLDLLNKRNGQKQSVDEHYRAVLKANEKGIAVDAFTMIYPWENEDDLKSTTNMIEFISNNPVNGVDEHGRPLLNNIDSTIMTPYQGTVFNDMLMLGKIPGVGIKNNLDPGLLFYKGTNGTSGWPYTMTELSQQRYEEEQQKRIAFRAKYR